MALASGPSAKRKKKTGILRLNLIPIMNLFIVVIPMLLVMWVSVQMAMLSINMGGVKSGSAGGGDQDKSGNTITHLRVGLFASHFEITEINKVKGSKKKPKKEIDTINAINFEEIDQALKSGSAIPQPMHDFQRLNTIIAELKTKYPKHEMVEVIPQPNVRFDTLLQVMDICKLNNFPYTSYSFTQTKTYQANK